MKKQPDERSIWLRAPRNNTRGYIILFYKGSKRIAWAHESTGQPCELGRMVRSWIKEGNLPSERMIQFHPTELETQLMFKEGAD